MRRRGSLTGPVILIALGLLFLVHTLSPQFNVGQLFAQYWPYLLIFWGVLQLVEVAVHTFRSPTGLTSTTPVGTSAGTWFLVILICLAGIAMYEFHRPDAWWRQFGFERGIVAFGEAHDYSVPTMQRSVGVRPRLVIENFRGDAKITGNDGTALTVTGHKSIRAFNAADADRADEQTPVEILIQGNTVTIRCNQGKTPARMSVTTDLEINIPRGASIEAIGRTGDFEISSIAGDVDLSSDNAGIRLQDIGGNVNIETHRSDLIQCANVKGTLNLKGRGDDVNLSQIAGQVTINGNYTGTVFLRDLAKPVKVENDRTTLAAQQVPGEIHLDRGSLSVQNVVGPLRLTTRATDISLNDFTDGLELDADRGDIDINPGRVPLGKMTIRTSSGNIDLALPESATLALTASTNHGNIDNEFSGAFQERTNGQGARLEGTIGKGPDVTVSTNRGSITVRKSSGVPSTPLAPHAPTPPSPPVTPTPTAQPVILLR